jgi:hypothetical protein
MSKTVMIDFCSKILDFKNAFMNNESTKSLMIESFKSGKISFNKSGDFDGDPAYDALQQKYNEVVSSFAYDTPILVQIALDLCADLFSNKSELLVQAEFDEINKLFVAYVSNAEFKKKIDFYMPTNPKIQELLQIFKGDDSPDNYNKRLLCVLLFLKFKRTPNEIFVDTTYIKGGEYYSAAYATLDGNIYRTSLNVGLLKEIRSTLMPELITGNYNNILQLIIIIVKMNNLTWNKTTHDHTKLTGTPLLQEFISFIPNVSIENIQKYKGEIHQYFSTNHPEIIEFLRSFISAYVLQSLPPIIDETQQNKLQELIKILSDTRK